MNPIVEPLSHWRRKLIFAFLFFSFIFALPMFMFYATGYRYDFWSEKPTIMATGGIYISADAQNSTIVINEEEVTNARVFRSASYIQGLLPGEQRIHVQAPGLHTWVKELNVQPHIVTEAEAFNLPLVPQVRFVTEYSNRDDRPVIFKSQLASSTALDTASSALPYFVATSSATSSFSRNAEYVLLAELFAKKASSTRQMTEVEKFKFSTTTQEENTSTTTVLRNNLMLYKNDVDVYVRAVGEGSQIPNYFCTHLVEEASISPTLIGPRLVSQETKTEKTYLDTLLKSLPNGQNKCRQEIKIDRKSQTVEDFTFLPENENLVLLQLTDGIYVVEVDDRSWQNSQLLYSGEGLTMLTYGNGIFVEDKDLIVEVFTELLSSDQ